MKEKKGHVAYLISCTNISSVPHPPCCRSGMETSLVAVSTSKLVLHLYRQVFRVITTGRLYNGKRCSAMLNVFLFLTVIQYSFVGCDSL